MNFNIDNLRFGSDFPCRIIVEIGINHNGNLDKAIYHAEIAIKAGAEIIKHQTHIADEEMSEEAKKIIPRNADESIYNVIKKRSLNEEEETKLQKYVKQKKKVFISTPFSFAAVDRLVRMRVPAFKIGSGECNNYPLLKYISKFKKPVILSTGMNLINNIKKSVSILKKNPLILLHCTNIYPTPSKYIKIDTINLLKKTFPKIPIGLSDHSSNLVACYAAIAMGACVVEKHFVVTKKQSGPDISSSMDQQELKQLLNFSHEYFKIKGVKRQISSFENATAKFAFGSVVSKTEIYKNEILSEKNITIKRPFSRDYLAKDINKVIGKKAIQDIAKNVIIKKRMIK